MLNTLACMLLLAILKIIILLFISNSINNKNYWHDFVEDTVWH
jgi:hypothetical protein